MNIKKFFLFYVLPAAICLIALDKIRLANYIVRAFIDD